MTQRNKTATARRNRNLAAGFAFAVAPALMYSGNPSSRRVSADETDGSPRSAPYAQILLDRNSALPGEEVVLTVYTDLSEAVGPVSAFQYSGQVPSWMETTASPNDVYLYTSEPQSPDIGTYVGGIFNGQTVQGFVHFIAQNRFVTGMVTVPPQYPPGVISPVGEVGQVKFRIAENTPRGGVSLNFAPGGAKYTACTDIVNGDYADIFISDKRGASLYVESVKGDVDGNGYIDMNDVSPFEQILLGNNVDPESVTAADMDGNGTVDAGDIQQFVDTLTFGQ